jgi:fumarate reductase subunit C
LSQLPIYTPYHPRWLRRPVSTYWWLEKWCYLRFILREATCMFVAWGVVFLLLLVNAVNQGTEDYSRFIAWSAAPWVLVLNLVSFFFIVYHAVTFFVAAPQALVVHIGGRRVPGHLIMLGHYGAWVVASLLVGWLLFGGQS